MAQGGGSAQKEYITVASPAFQRVLCGCKLLSHRKIVYTGFLTDYPQSNVAKTYAEFHIFAFGAECL
eukprot:7388027-Prymnesium_polylepis.2